MSDPTAGHAPNPAAQDSDFWPDVALVALRANLHHCEPEWRLAPRVRPNHQIWLVEAGSGELTVARTQHLLEGGVVVLVPPAVPHWAHHDPRSPLQCYVLHFEVRILGAHAPGALAALPSLLRPKPSILPELRAAAADMCREVGDPAPEHVLLANAAITRLVGLLWSVNTANRSLGSIRAALPAHTRLEPVLAHIADHYDRPLTLAELASVAGLSPTHLSHIFRGAVGLSPFQYLQRYRMRRARHLLQTTDLGIAEIGRRVGFTDPAYFSRVFRRLEGMTPTQYRDMCATAA
ncbi:MAG TPA: AraC family transcriptional regulator [Actinopolymorphaceae bacterium]